MNAQPLHVPTLFVYIWQATGGSPTSSRSSQAPPILPPQQDQFRLPSVQALQAFPQSPELHGHAAQTQRASLPAPTQIRWGAASVEPSGIREGQLPETTPSHHVSPPLPWSTPQEEITSPQSTLSSNPYPAEIAPLRWFGLLADDADNLNRLDFAQSLGGQGAPKPPDESGTTTLRLSSYGTQGFHSPSFPVGAPASTSYSQRYPSTSGNPAETPQYAAERQHWQSSVALSDHELPIFKHFVECLSIWLDLFDPLRHFSTFVPQLAMKNEGLMKAILALSSRHLSIRPGTAGESLDRTAAVQYYSESLQYLQGAMRYDSFNRSLELLATAITISTYEMIDGAGSGWERHLKGVFWIQRSQDINGQSGGLKQAVWWCWLRQDVWAAFRERRRCFSFYKPTRPYQLMDHFDIASRAIYLLAQCVNYASEEETKMGEVNLQLRIERAGTLFNMLDEWRANLTVHFNPLPLMGAVTETAGPFRPIWINPPGFAAALQMHNFARILLLVHQPAAGGYREYMTRDAALQSAIDTIGGVATVLDAQPGSVHSKGASNEADGAAVVSTQCLYAAGLYVNDDGKRQEICRLIERHQEKTRWPVQSLADELKSEWARGRPP
ncbi:uncharacterized protein J3D65DRAFT_269266 [Phyllosticta citribraziliensis]|uniref:Transcription factor domain-containing protein n=1 Tax=Phyllosticta citribraziliensis TaxID=989973 RepID=A0ABR1M2E8_9PEZI